MASVKVKFNCGCGYSTDKLEEAVKHSDKLKHTLTAHGTVENK